MLASARVRCILVLLLGAFGSGRAAEGPPSRVEVGKLGKAATALVEVKARRSYGSAFCVHPSGLFLTNEHVIQGGEVTLVLNPGLKGEKAFRARVVRADKDLDLALLRADGARNLPALALGSDKDLSELEEVIAFGFPFGTALAPDRKEYPAVSVNVGRVTSLRRQDGKLHQVQLDAVLNPGNSGGPVLDNSGKVVGVVKSGVRGAGVNFAIPVSRAADFLARPDVRFDPPPLSAANLYKPVPF
jgi:S1-C subfamily serine protease